MQSSYIGLHAKLSRSYLTQYLLIVILSLMSLWTMRQTIDSKIEETQFRMAASCHGLEIAATSLASTPHYVAAETNAAIASSISSTVAQMTKLMLMMIKLLNQLLLILLKRYQRLMVCILDSILAGSLGAVSLYSQEITQFIQTQMDGISTALNSGLDGINSQIRSINGGVQDATNAVTNLFTNSGSNVNIPTFSLPEVTQRLKFTLPESFQASLQNLTNTVPDLEDAQNALGALISTPFNLLSDNLNSSMKKVSFSELNLPIPAKAADASFCDNVPVGWIPKMADGILSGFTVTIWILIVLGVLIILGNAGMIYWDHKREERQLDRISSYMGSSAFPSNTVSKETITASEPLDILKAVGNPLAWLIFGKLEPKLKKFSLKMRLRWFLDYTIYHPSFLFLGIGLLGLILIYVQIFILDRAKISALTAVNNELLATSDTINNAVQKMVSETVDPYVIQANRRIEEIETQTNQIVFGWINDTVRTINNTSSSFTTGFNDIISKSFASVPPLKDAVSKFVNCMVGASFESIIAIGETLQGSAYMEFPRVNSSIGKIDGDALSDLPVLAERMAVKLDSNSSNDEKSSPEKGYVFQKEIDRMVDYYKSILETQKIAFYICLGFGALGWLLGMFGALFSKFS